MTMSLSSHNAMQPPGTAATADGGDAPILAAAIKLPAELDRDADGAVVDLADEFERELQRLGSAPPRDERHADTGTSMPSPRAQHTVPPPGVPQARDSAEPQRPAHGAPVRRMRRAADSDGVASDSASLQPRKQPADVHA